MSLGKWCVLLVAVILVVGCAGSSKKLNDVRLGMSRPEVVKVMGRPSHISARENIEFLSYNLQANSLFSDEYFVRLKDGKVDLFGRRGDFGVIF